jgi:subtilase family serine protease
MYNSTGSSSDYNMFLSAFGLSSYAGGLTTVHPGGVTEGCSDPGLGDGVKEVTIDVEWSAAAAPGAEIEIDSCDNGSGVESSVNLALHNRINGDPMPLPNVISNSYGACEQSLEPTLVSAIDMDYEQAGTEGVSVFAASGDGGAVACNTGLLYATEGLSVNGFASSPHVVAVGGTDFSDTYSGTNGTYWNTSNSSVFGSAMSYIPEIAWNSNCASPLLTNWYDSGASPWSFCTSVLNDHNGFSALETVTAGGGGASNCATMSHNTCEAGWSKPEWQSYLSGLGNPDDSVRDIPDVSIHAAGGGKAGGGGVWGHAFIVCYSDTTNGGYPCSPVSTYPPSTWNAGGGTSFAAPIWAGIQALIDQSAGESQGFTAPTLYSLAETEYENSAMLANCNSSAVESSECIFYDVTHVATAGDSNSDVPCGASSVGGGVGPYCYRPLGENTIGIETISPTPPPYDPAYPSSTGWDFATGIGAPNVSNLISNW